MSEFKSSAITFGSAMVPYLLVAWAWSAISNERGAFWLALTALFVVRLFFSIIETLGSVLAWRLYGKKHAVARMLAFLRANKYPKRFYRHDSFLAYLTRIDDPEFPESLRMSARQTEQTLEFFENVG